MIGKLERDIGWNIVSLGVAGVSGILLNLLIGLRYDAGALGVFNQVFAAYIFFSQFAVAGVHFSTLKHVAEGAQDPPRAGAIVFSALLLTGCLASLSSAAFWLAGGIIGSILESPGVTEGIAWAAPGLIFFALNKVLLAAFNGLRWMGLYAFCQALRPVLVLAAFIVAAILRAPPAALPVALTVGEGLLFILALLRIIPRLAGSLGGAGVWVRRHVDFGLRSFLGGALIELNTRVDVLMLGYFASDRLVGIYSLAAILAEGLYQLLIVIRNNINPLLVTLTSRMQLDELRRLAVRTKGATYLLMLGVGAIAVAGYPFILENLTRGSELARSWPIFAILMLGIVISSGYVPFGGILLQAGRPGLHTAMIGGVVAFNCAANLLLIPFWGAIGAAVATSLSFVFAAFLLVILTQRTVGVRV
ncbi:MAG: polysaccharide biosynthesis C-terminal domain-containing protein [Planctomycetota bacterium]